MSKAMEDAGVLKSDGELTDEFYESQIKLIKKIANEGMEGVDFACGYSSKIKPGPGSIPDDIENKEKYPEFHQIVMGKFKEISQAFNVEGQFYAPFPFWHPVALAAKLDINVDLPTINLASFPSLTPVSIVSMLAELGVDITLPDLLAKLPSLGPIPTAPTLELPKLPDFDINLFDARFLFNGWALKLPEIFSDFVLQVLDPSFVVNLAKIPPDICPIVDKSAGSSLSGENTDEETAKAAVDAAQAIHVAKCMPVAAVHSVIGRGKEIAEAVKLIPKTERKGLPRSWSPFIAKFVCSHESFRDDYYLDVHAVAVGIGHDLNYSDVGVLPGVTSAIVKKSNDQNFQSEQEIKQVLPGKVDRNVLLQIFLKDLDSVAKLVCEQIKKRGASPDDLTQNQFDVLVDFTFGIGPQAITSKKFIYDTLGAFLQDAHKGNNTGQSAKNLADLILKIRKDVSGNVNQVLTKVREAEAALFLTPDEYTRDPDNLDPKLSKKITVFFDNMPDKAKMAYNDTMALSKQA